MRAPKGASGLVPASTRPAPRPLTHSSTAHKPFGNPPKAPCMIPSRIRASKRECHAGAILTAKPPTLSRAPECGVANPVRARMVAPRAQTRVITHKPFGNAPKAVSRFAGCIPASSSAGCGKGASFVDFSFAGKKSRKRGEWAFRYVQTNFSSGRKELFPRTNNILTALTHNLQC